MHLYEILDVPCDASSEEIEYAYRVKICGMNTQDIRGRLLAAVDATYLYRYAFSILSDEASRSAYDAAPARYDQFTAAPFIL
ncbi:hypothetical protein [Agrobacterium larrymoorei]|uniref:J domain-containing protein n=1 Tax=Agrobacterium larrymoorei TaxID=160699 RepID=A0AAF0HG43_9HYPH|nr:hypothetical protein [Agrobacterium larrymoorei]WHA44106.1 hypothetical protein CFBP5477_022085 [Agrobacterium larrymoorei]